MRVLARQEPLDRAGAQAVRRVRHEVRDAAYTAVFTLVASVVGAVGLVMLVSFLGELA